MDSRTPTPVDPTDCLLGHLLDFLDWASQDQDIVNAVGLGRNSDAVETTNRDFTLDRSNLEVLARAALAVESPHRGRTEVDEFADPRFALDKASVDHDLELMAAAIQAEEQPSQITSAGVQTEDNINLHVLADAALSMQQSSRGELTMSNAEANREAGLEAQANPSANRWTGDEVRYLAILCEFTKATAIEVTAALNRRFGRNLTVEDVVQQWAEMKENGDPLFKIVSDDITWEEAEIITSGRLSSIP